MQCLQLCDGLVRGTVDGLWSSKDFLAIVTRKQRMKFKKFKQQNKITGQRGWGSLLKTEELQELLASLKKKVNERTRELVEDILARLLAGEDGFIERVSEDAVMSYFRCWKRGDSLFLLAEVRGTILQGTAYWSAIDTMLAVWPRGSYSHAFARRYFNGLKGQQALAVVADLLGPSVSLSEPMMPLQVLLCFIDTLRVHQQNRYAGPSEALKARLLSATRVVIKGRAVLRGVLTAMHPMPDNKHIRGTSNGFWSVHDFINVVCGRPLDDAYGPSTCGAEWETFRFREELRNDSQYGPTTTLNGLKHMLQFLGESEYGARVALML
jgi:hypothetical protein